MHPVHGEVLLHVARACSGLRQSVANLCSAGNNYDYDAYDAEHAVAERRDAS
jgi:hypothetical protein